MSTLKDACTEGLSETTSLPHKGRGKVSVYPTLPKPHMWDCTGYVVVVVVVYCRMLVYVLWSFKRFSAVPFLFANIL